MSFRLSRLSGPVGCVVSVPSLTSHLAVAVLFFLLPLLAARAVTEADGVVLIQAEQPTVNTPRTIGSTTYSWNQSTARADFTGTGFMEAAPSDGTSVAANWEATSPGLGYAITFANPGTYYVWVRAFAGTAPGASVCIGLNGVPSPQPVLTVPQDNAWRWTNTGNGIASPVAITVPAAGTYSLDVWMRDAGFRLDRILLTRNPNYSPELSSGFWRNQNIYQIITDRFFDGNPGNNLAAPNFNPTGAKQAHGGDFSGIEKKLDYIRALGVTAIWISPVLFNGNGNYHGYASNDFYSTNPRMGTLEELRHLISEAHKRGLLVINDVVVNHGAAIINSTDSGYPTFKYPPDGYSLSYSGTLRYAPPFDSADLASTFHNNGSPQIWTDSTQVEYGELLNLDDFRTETTPIREKMTAIWTHWIQSAGFDAYRLDTVKHVDMGFWDYWSPRIRSAAEAADKPNFIQFGEVFDGSDSKCGSYTGTKSTSHFKMESVLDYPLFNQVSSVFATANGSTKQIEDRYGNLTTTNYDASALDSLVTFLDNHDQPRFLSAGGGVNRLNVALAFLYTSRGIPSLYYGTEQDFTGGADPANREDMFDGQYESGPSLGDNFNMTSDRFKLIAKLNNLRRLYPALRTGTHVNLWNTATGPGLLAYARQLGNEEAYVVLNTASSPQTIAARPTLHTPGTVMVNVFNLAETRTVVQASTRAEIPPVTVQANSFVLYVAQSRLKELDPVVETIGPAHDAAGVPTGSPITVTFSRPMSPATTQAAFSTSPATTGTWAWSANNTVLAYSPLALAGNTLYTVRLAETATDSTGLALFGAFESRFTTGDPPPPPDIAVERSTASDSAANPVYDIGGFLHQNGGRGFAEWSGSGTGGSYIGPTATSTKALAIYAGGSSGKGYEVSRSFAQAMETGETFAFALGCTGVAAGGEIGVNLFSGGGFRLGLKFQGGASEWLLNNGGADFGTGIPWSGTTAMEVIFTRNAGNGYNIRLTSGAKTFTGNNHIGSSGEMAIDKVQFYSAAQGAGEHFCFDHFERAVPLSAPSSTLFGTRPVATSGSPVTYTVSNQGTGVLSSLALAKIGTNTEDFTLGALGVATLAPGEKTTFTLTFAPTGAGERSATVHLSSNDPDENPFAILLAGTGLDNTPPQTPFQRWASSFGLNGIAAEPTADSDGDGWSNAQEFAFGLDPSAAGGALVQTVPATGTGFTITFLQRSEGVYTVRSSTDLAAGFPGTLTPTVAADQSNKPSSDYTRYEATLPAGTERGFLKVEAIIP